MKLIIIKNIYSFVNFRKNLKIFLHNVNEIFFSKIKKIAKKINIKAKVNF